MVIVAHVQDCAPWGVVIHGSYFVELGLSDSIIWRGGIIWRLGEQWLSDCSCMGVGVEFGGVCVVGRSARSDCSRVWKVFVC